MSVRRAIAVSFAVAGLVAGPTLAASAAPQSESRTPAVSQSAPQAAKGCAKGRLCLKGPGWSRTYYKCGTYDLRKLNGNGTFVNNQTRGTTAKFRNKNGGRWESTAPDKGTASWSRVASVKPC